MNRLFLAGFLSAAALLAQAPPPPGPADGPLADDPPSRVARLQWLSGDVAFQPATVDAWSNATLNYPLTTGDHLFVNPGGRAELQIDANTIRLNSNSNFGFLNLDDHIAQISLNEGSIEIRLRQLDANDSFEIDTPNGAVTLQRAGEYRIDTDPNRNITLVTARTGQAEMYQDGNTLTVTAHQTVRFSDAGPEVNQEYPADDFDGFVTSRNNAVDAQPQATDVPDSMPGARDLYTYGSWTEDPLYGRVWMPPVQPGWTPYSTGRWAFVEPWGWTWVDDAPWGFAPFHYGRWVEARGGWVWIPGARTYRPVYSPALVGFIGGGGFGVSVGWFPLGPREPWVPAWGASRGYINRVNVMYVPNVAVINVTNVRYVNRENVVVVSQVDFAAARPIRGSAVQFSAAQIRDAQVIGSGPRVVPVRASIVIGAARPAPVLRDRVVVARTPPPPAPVSFQARQQLLAQNNGQPLRASQVNQLRAQQPAAVVTHQQVRAIGNPQPQQGRGFGATAPAQGNQPASNRVPDRMSSRPPGAEPRPQPQQAAPSQPQAVPAARPTATPAARPAETQPRQADRPQGKQPPARRTSAPRRKEDERDDKR